MRKVLLFAEYSCNITDGGPSGFLAHNLVGHSDCNYILTKNLVALHQKRKKSTRAAYKILNLCQSFLSCHPESDHISKTSYFEWFRSIRNTFFCSRADRYAVIFFHDIFSLFFCADLIKKNQVVILQSHCPELPSDEIKSLFSNSAPEYDLAIKAQVFSFERADHIVFPNKFALEPYKPLLNIGSRQHFIASGCSDIAMNSPSEIPLDPDCINLLFIGRRNCIKGYDIVMSAFRDAHRRRNELRLFLAGGGAKEHGEGVVDLGLISNPSQWIKSCDYVINFNRSSYFDLSLMETLSIGTPLIIACTGGHKEFESMHTPGIIKIDACDQGLLSNALCSPRLLKKADNQGASRSNRNLFEERYFSARYRERLSQFLDMILGGCQK